MNSSPPSRPIVSDARIVALHLDERAGDPRVHKERPNPHQKIAARIDGAFAGRLDTLCMRLEAFEEVCMLDAHLHHLFLRREEELLRLVREVQQRELLEADTRDERLEVGELHTPAAAAWAAELLESADDRGRVDTIAHVRQRHARGSGASGRRRRRGR